ncbi:hypothetical protein SEPCBS119000_003977 [Sporothrix epigloea]|uniref:AoPex11B-like protein n=1 Tax=Sporothrix epigloea TaxID=1892477 RepID=A0ABP0DRP2_9PEZI
MSFQQLVLFTADANGLERSLRLVQALLQLIVSVPVLLAAAAPWLLPVAVDKAGATQPVAIEGAAVLLAGARDRVNLVRRVLRMFMFVGCFDRAHRLYLSLFSAPELTPGQTAQAGRRRQYDVFFDALAATFAGIYLLLETAVLVDALGVPGLAVWGPARAEWLDIEGQRYWFLSLSCSVLVGMLRMASVADDLPLPPAAEPTEKEAVDAEQDKRARQAVQEARRNRLVALGRRVVADAVDVLLPGAVVGWTPLAPATVGWVMSFTTLLTGYDVWLRCGQEAAAASM